MAPVWVLRECLLSAGREAPLSLCRGEVRYRPMGCFVRAAKVCVRCRVLFGGLNLLA